VGRDSDKSIEEKFSTISLELVTETNYKRFHELNKEVIRGNPMFKSVVL
jgi:hypothetical protein